MTSKIIELIMCDLHKEGKGTKEDPTRLVYQLYTKDGQLLVSYDPYTKDQFVSDSFPELVLNNKL